MYTFSLSFLCISGGSYVSGRSRILKGGGGGVPLSRMFSTALVHAHDAGDAYVQNEGSVEPKEPPGSATVLVLRPCNRLSLMNAKAQNK